MSVDFTKPPHALANAAVIEYVTLPDFVHHVSTAGLYVNGKELGSVPCLAICQNVGKDEFLLLYCDGEWNVLAVVACASVREARARAERQYPGVSICWTQAQISRQEASGYLDSLPGELRCAFCGRRPEEVKTLFEKGGARICDSCVKEFCQLLHKEQSA
jgi:hypothetical protein